MINRALLKYINQKSRNRYDPEDMANGVHCYVEQELNILFVPPYDLSVLNGVFDFKLKNHSTQSRKDFALQIGMELFPTDEEKQVEFAHYLLVPLWHLEPLAVRSKRTMEDLKKLFQVDYHTLNHQLRKLI